MVFRDIGDIRLDNVCELRIENGFDAIVRLTSSAICGTDLHFVQGTVPGMVPGTVLGHDSSRQVKERFPIFPTRISRNTSFARCFFRKDRSMKPVVPGEG